MTSSENQKDQLIAALPASPIVSTEWLAKHLGHPQLRIVDICGKVLPPTDPKPHYFASPELYAAGHIPGAVFVDWTRDIVDNNDPVPVQVAPADQYAALMSRLGIGDDTVVVAYDTTMPFFAGRLLWTLRYYGHTAVRVLDGGFAKWQAEGRPLETDIPTYTPAHFTPRPQTELRRTVDDILQALNGATMIIDARTPEEFRGEQSRAARGGHVPGAANVYFGEFLEGVHKTFASPDDIRRRLAAKGIDVTDRAEQDVIVYCNGGVSAMVTALAMEIAGTPAPALYDGSWNEWGNREDLPLEQ